MKSAPFLSLVTLSAVAFAPHALALDRMSTGNGSMTFVAVDSTGTPTSVLIDLGYLFSSFDPIGGTPLSAPTGVAGALLAPGTTVTWDFVHDSLTVNGVAQAGNYQWSSQFALFQAAAQAGETRFGVVGAAIGGYPNFFLTSGLPTPAQLAAQTGADTANMGLADTLYANNQGKGTIPANGISSSVVGANAVVGATTAGSGYVGNSGNFGTNWRSNLKWSALVAEGATSNFYYLADNIDGDGNPLPVSTMAGQFVYQSGTLTWQATAVPEAQAYTLALAGLGVLAVYRRRRR